MDQGRHPAARWRGTRRTRRPDPFAALGLPAAPGLTGDDVRAAWRRVATATHPDRADGGDPERFAAAAAAYTALRTPFGRGEALADLRTEPGRQTTPGWAASRRELTRLAGALRARDGRARDGRAPGRQGTAGQAAGRQQPAGRERAATGWPARAGLAAGRVMSRVRRGRPARLMLRAGLATAVGVAAALAAGAAPATPALITGALTWLALTAHHDLAPAQSPTPVMRERPGPGPGSRQGRRPG